MYKSVENKMQGNNLICWNSLSLRAKYHLVFQWKSQPKDKKFKHFIKEYFPKYLKRQDVVDGQAEAQPQGVGGNVYKILFSGRC